MVRPSFRLLKHRLRSKQHFPHLLSPFFSPQTAIYNPCSLNLPTPPPLVRGRIIKSCVLIYASKLLTLPAKLHPLLLFQSNFSSLTQTTNRILTLIGQPNWENNTQLKSIASHISPALACQVINSVHVNNDIELGVKFFKWVCKQSTYCYPFDCRTRLLKLIAYCNCFEIVHKAIVWLVKECCLSEINGLELMNAVDDMRKVGFRLNYPCYSSILMCLAKLQMGLSTFLVYEKMVGDGFVLGLIDCRSVINGFCKSGIVQAAEMFLSRVLKVGFVLDVHMCTSLVLGSCRVGDLREAFRVFDVMSMRDGCCPNSVTYAILIHGLCEAGRLEEAFRLKEESSKKGCLASVRTYTLLIKAVCDVGLTSKALGLLDEMGKKGCVPNVHTYTVLIDGLCTEGKIEEANGIFRKMLTDGLVPGAVTFNALINGYCKQERVVSAFELLALMEKRNCKPNIRTYNELMEGLCRVNKPYKAMALMGRVVDSGLQPDKVTLNTLIGGFCKGGQLNMAFRLLYSMDSLDLVPDVVTYTTLIDWLCKEGKLDQAIGLLGMMKKKGVSPDEVTFTALIDGYCKAGKIENAFTLFKRMIQNRCLTSPHTFNSLLDVLNKEVKMNEGSAILGKMLKYGLVPSVVTYTILIDGFFREGNISRSLEMFELMKQFDCPPNAYTYTTVIAGLCQNGRVEEAETFLLDMPRIGVCPNDVTYTALVKSHVKTCDLDHAFELLHAMVKQGCQPNDQIYGALLGGIIFSENATVVGAKKSAGDSDASFDCFCSNVFTKTKISHAHKLLDKIKEYKCPVMDLYNFLVMGFYKVGRICEGDYFIHDMVRNGLFPNKAVCSLIVEHFCEERQFDCCLTWMKLILENGVMPSYASYSSLVIALRNEGMVDEASQLLMDISSQAGIEDKAAISPYVEFLGTGNEPYKCLELLNTVIKMHYQERPII